MSKSRSRTLLGLFGPRSKGEAKKYVRDLTVTSDDLFEVLLAGKSGLIEPFRYACHFDQMVPSHLNPTDEELRALASNGVGLIQGLAQKTVRKIGQIFVDRRLFAAYLFYHPT